MKIDKDLLLKMLDESFLVPLSGGGISECNVYDGSGIAFDPNGKIITCTHTVNTPVAEIIDDNEKLKSREVIRDTLLLVRQAIGPTNWKYPV